AVNPCLDPTDADYSCELDVDGAIFFGECGLTDEDVDDLTSCLDVTGREDIVEIFLPAGTAHPAGFPFAYSNPLSRSPEGVAFPAACPLPPRDVVHLSRCLATQSPQLYIQGAIVTDHRRLSDFGGLTTSSRSTCTTARSGSFLAVMLSLLRLWPSLDTPKRWMRGNALTTLPAGIFEGLTNLTFLGFDENALTTLPEAIFDGLTGLTLLRLGENNLTTLPEGVFEGLTNLEGLLLNDNALTTLPAGIFEGLTKVDNLRLWSNGLTTLPAEIFESLTNLASLSLFYNVLTTLPEGIFDGLTRLERLSLQYNALRTLPEGIFEGLTSLETLYINNNSLECLPTVPSSVTVLDVDSYGDECGCSIPNVTDNVCGLAACTPGPVGYTCGGTTLAPTPTLTLTTEAPVPAPTPTAPPRPLKYNLDYTFSGAFTPLAPATSSAPSFSATSLAPTPAPFSGIISTINPEKSSPDSTPIVAGVVSAVVGAALIALVVLRKRQRAANQKAAQPPAAADNHEQGPDQHHDVHCPAPPMLTVRSGGDESPYQQRTPPEADNIDDRVIVPPSAPVALAGEVQSRSGHRANAATDLDAGLAGEGATTGGLAKTSMTDTASTAAASATTASTAERAEIVEFQQKQRVADAASAAGDTGASSAAEGRSSDGDIGLSRAVLAAAQELAHSCQVPGISEAAGVLCIMANLFTDSRENDKASDVRLKQCRSIVMALKRAEKVVGKVGDTTGEAARILIEDVHDAIYDLVELIKTFQSKNKLSKLCLSTLFKRRQDELDAVVDRAIMRLQLGLQLQVGHDMSLVKDGVKAGSTSESTSEYVAEARIIRRQRKLDQVEIPEDHLFITTDLLGKGGFGEVYLADYNGHNAAAILNDTHDLGALDENQQQRETRQRRGFLRELEAMIRLRGPNTVNVFGAVTSLSDRMVLVMELLPNGDLLTLLKKSREPLPEEQSRCIIRDICTGMAFLHSKKTVHGDLKSSNVLLDGGGRAKIGDFGTSRWSQHTNSTGLATYTTKAHQSTQMSLAWSAPEV
ncbi:unnamed protein product, partial [Ectocarpus sp. 4 AP-2014]